MADVAAAAGVTKITVSRYLRQPAKVAAGTAAAIDKALAATGYLPNKQAGALAGVGGAGIVAALIPSIANSIFAETVQGLADGLAGSGHELLLASTAYSVEREEAQLRALLGWFPSAVVVTGRRHTDAARALLAQARARGTPVIEIWDHDAGAGPADAPTRIGFDHAEVGRAMAAHLVERGHKSLAYVDSGVAEDFRAHERGEGFMAEAKRLKVAARLVAAPGTEAIGAGRQALAALLDTKGKPTVAAAAFANDHLACGALLEARARKLDVPKQLALLGFGDFAIGRELTPALSSVQVPRYEIGRAAAAALRQALATGERTADVALPWTLVARAST